MNGNLKKLMASVLAVALSAGNGAVPVSASEVIGQSEGSQVSSQSETENIDETELQTQAREADLEESTVPETSQTALSAMPNVLAVQASEYNKITVSGDASQRNFTIRVQNLSDTSFKTVYIPVWSTKNGQDDIRWYTANKVSDTEWACTVDIANHKSDAGTYEIHAYGERSDGSKVLLNAGSFNVQGIGQASVACTTSDKDLGIYHIEVTGLVSPAGISKVEIPVWSENNGQDDIVWYEAEQSQGKWYIDVDASQHGYDTGTYNAHVYAYDNRGMQALAGSTKFTVSAVPKNQLHVALNSDQSKATITLKNAALESGTEYVSFPVWGEVSGQNDIIWYRANKVDAHTYQVTIPISNHKECGTYQAHAYAVKGSKTTLLTNSRFSVAGISGKVSVINKDDANGYFTLTVSDILAPAALTEMQIAVWSNKNGQDDIQWYTAQKSGNQWIVKVDIGNHNLDTGIYNAHVYVTDSRGIHGLIANTTINVKAPTAAPKVTAEVLSDHATVSLTATNIIGAIKVQIPVWGEKDGQNDIVWYDMTQTDSRTWKATISLGNHMETGSYQAHAYATINNKTQLCAGTSFQIDKIIVNAISFSNRNDETGNFTVNVQNISAVPNANAVLVGVWSAADGQDDLTWYTAKNVNGKWTANINTQNHNYDRGVYYVHVYAYNAAGQSAFVGGLTADVVINGKLGFVREGSNIYYYPTLNNKAYGFERINGDRYFFDRSTGAMAVGWNYIDGYKYYFDGYGKMVQDVDALIGLQSSYILKINKQSNCVTMYAYDPATASYCIPVKAMRCSTGDATPLGTYPLSKTYRWLLMYNGTYCQYLSLITGDYLIHSITYERYGDIYSLQTVGYNQLGVNKSAGCVRLVCGDAYWVYNLVNSGRLRQVTIYNSPDPGPFDQPYVAPIPDNQTWDPTDPAL